MSEKNIVYSMPIKVVGNGALKITIPKEIAEKMRLKKGDKVIWIYYDNGAVEIKPEIRNG